MERYTFPNQRFVCVHRERPTANFLGIKNENWMAAARDLTPHALLLYLYFAANANNYVLAVSPAAIRQAVGMPRSTYHDQFHVLEDKGYLIPTKGNTFDFLKYRVRVPSQMMRKSWKSDRILKCVRLTVALMSRPIIMYWERI